MDTFMDKLAQKFTAQEMIKANAAAETEEMNRLRAQVQEYTECLNRMQQICAQIEQTAVDARGKVESAQLNTDDLREQLLEIRQNMQEAPAQSEGTNVESLLEEQFESLKKAQTELFDNIRSVQNAGLESIQTQEELLENLRGNLDSQLSGIKNVQSTQLDSIKGLQAEQLESIRGLQQAQLEGLKGLQDAQFDTMKISLEDQLDSMRSMVKAQVSGIKSGQESQLDSLRNVLEAQNKTLETQLGEMKAELETQLNGSNDFVHRECVKVYRNVQAVVGEENNKQSDNLEYMIKPVGAKVKTLFPISVAALVFSLLSVLLQVLSMLHIL